MLALADMNGKHGALVERELLWHLPYCCGVEPAPLWAPVCMQGTEGAFPFFAQGIIASVGTWSGKDERRETITEERV